MHRQIVYHTPEFVHVVLDLVQLVVGQRLAMQNRLPALQRQAVSEFSLCSSFNQNTKSVFRKSRRILADAFRELFVHGVRVHYPLQGANPSSISYRSDILEVWPTSRIPRYFGCRDTRDLKRAFTVW